MKIVSRFEHAFDVEIARIHGTKVDSVPMNADQEIEKRRRDVEQQLSRIRVRQDYKPEGK